MRRMAASCGALLPMLVLAAPALAKPLAHERWEWPVYDAWSDCGPAYVTEGTWVQDLLYKEARGDGPPLITWHYDSELVTRNPRNGKYVTESFKGIWKDLKGWPVEGTIYHFVAQQTGGSYTLVDSDGKQVLKDRGLLRLEFDADVGPDPADPLDNSGIINDVLLALHGPHQSWDVDYCEILDDLIG
jgi:hypothetical protein